MISEKYLEIGRKIKDRLVKRGHNLDYYAGTIIGDMIEEFVEENKININYSEEFSKRNTGVSRTKVRFIIGKIKKWNSEKKY